MKKIIFLALVLVSLKTFAQYPATQTLGSDSTLVSSKGALKSRLINTVFADTTAANLQRVRQYPGAQIFTTTDNKLWLRDASATYWIEKGGGTQISNITTSGDSIFICDFNSCDTIISAVQAQNVSILNDSTLLVCDTSFVCDTLHIPRTQFATTLFDTTTIYQTINNINTYISDTSFTNQFQPAGIYADTLVRLNDSITRVYYSDRTFKDDTSRISLSQTNIDYITNIINYIDSTQGEDTTFILSPNTYGTPFLYSTVDPLSDNDSIHINFPENNLAGDSVLTTDASGNLKMKLVTAGTTIDTTSLSNRINLKLNTTDTSGKWVQDARSNAAGDSLIVVKNAVRSAYKYPSGGAASSGRDTLVPVWNRRGVVMTGWPTAEGMNNYEPSVIREGSPVILTSATTVFKMWYTSGWLSKNINYAESSDGITWVKYASNPVVTNHSRGFVIKNGSTYYLYASGSNPLAIDRYTSSDGIAWTLATANVITASANIYNTSVIVDGSTWRLLIDKYDGGSGYGQLYYTSPDGITWTVQNGGAPVLTGLGQGATFLKKIGSTYYVWEGETGGVATLPTDIYRYSSPDMITWTKNGTQPSFPRRQADEGPKTSVGQVQDVHLLSVDSSVYLYYSASINGLDSAAGQRIKLAIANMTFEKLVGTLEGDGADVIVQPAFRQSGTSDLYYRDGSVVIGSGVPSTKAILDLTSTTKAFLPPRMTTTQMNAISSPATGSVIYNTTTNAINYYNGTAWLNPAGWSLIGNAGTDSSVNWLGTLDTKPLQFRQNNIARGGIYSTLTSTWFGSAPVTGTITVAGVNNTFMGWAAAGTALTSGTMNVGIGSSVLQLITSGSSNVVIGHTGARSLTTGLRNTGIGHNSLGAVSTNSDNTALGYMANNALTGSLNTAIGDQAIGNAVFGTGGSNTALGASALYNVTNGLRNVGMGIYAGGYITTQNDNLVIDNQDRTDYVGNQNKSLVYGNFSATPTSQIFNVNARHAIFNAVPSALMDIAPGTADAGTAPLKIRYTTLATTATNGASGFITITFAAQPSPPFRVGSKIVIAGVTPTGYNGTWTVLACTTTTVIFSGATTGAQTVAGTIVQGQLMTTPESGAIESDGTHLYWTDNTGTRKQLD